LQHIDDNIERRNTVHSTLSQCAFTHTYSNHVRIFLQE